MSLEEWEKLNGVEAKKVLEEINPHIEPVPFNPDTTTVRKQKLSFYEEYILYEMTDLSAIPGVRKYAIYKPGDVHVLNWTNQMIYEVNENAPIKLDERKILDYAKFFFTYVRGRHGRFLIVEAVDDIRWQSEPPEQGRKVMQEMLEPITLLSQEPDGTYILECYMVFKDSLFKTFVHVKPDGLISLSDEELKIEGMPVVPDAISA